MARSTDAVRGPREDLTRRSVTVLEPGIAILEPLTDMLRVVPSAATTDTEDEDPSDLSSSLGRARSAVDGSRPRHVASAARTLAAGMERTPRRTMTWGAPLWINDGSQQPRVTASRTPGDCIRRKEAHNP